MDYTEYAAAFPTPNNTVVVGANMFWALAETQFAEGQRIYKQGKSSASCWQQHILTGLASLYTLLRLSDKRQQGSLPLSVAVNADTEARTRLRIAQALMAWTKCKTSTVFDDTDSRDEPNYQLNRALMVLPKTDIYLEAKYEIIATQCRLYISRGELTWVEQKLKSIAADTGQRGQYGWVYYFMNQLACLYQIGGSLRMALSTLRQINPLISGQVGQDLVLVQQLALMVQMRDWRGADSLVQLVKTKPEFAQTLPQVRTRFWMLQASALVMRGKRTSAQQMACDPARLALQEWQKLFAQQRASQDLCDGGGGALINVPLSGGGSLYIAGWSYYEAHAWTMLVSAYAVCDQQGGGYEQASRFLQLALNGIKMGEEDGELVRRLQLLKLHVLLHWVDISLDAMRIEEAKQTLDNIMSMGNGVWESSRDAIALRWAMYLHRTGETTQAIDAYQCVAKNGDSDLQYAALTNLAVLYLTTDLPESTTKVRRILAQHRKQLQTDEVGRHAILEFLEGLESSQREEEPVKSKTHLLSCLKAFETTSDHALQGWTLCLLGALMLPTGQYDQAMRMCGAGQELAQQSGDLLQKAASIGILSHIEQAIGDPTRHQQLQEISQRCLEQHNIYLT